MRPAAHDGEQVAGEGQRLGLGLDRALLEPVGRVVGQLTVRFGRTLQQLQKMLLDEAHPAVAAPGQLPHQLAEIARGLLAEHRRARQEQGCDTE